MFLFYLARLPYLSTHYTYCQLFVNPSLPIIVGAAPCARAFFLFFFLSPSLKGRTHGCAPTIIDCFTFLFLFLEIKNLSLYNHGVPLTERCKRYMPKKSFKTLICCEKCAHYWTCETKWHRGEHNQENVCCPKCNFYALCRTSPAKSTE